MTESVAPMHVIEETSAYWRVLFDYPLVLTPPRDTLFITANFGARLPTSIC